MTLLTGIAQVMASLPFVWDASTKDLLRMNECDLFEIFTPIYAVRWRSAVLTNRL